MLQFRPSELAAAALISAAKLLKKPTIWNKEVQELTKLSPDTLKPVVEEV
jgi:transcription initiation factor TFIIIB Brf1 subunit/transcription initiation factor TFIIB